MKEYFSSQIGQLLLQFDEGVLTKLLFNQDSLQTRNNDNEEHHIKKVSARVVDQLSSYFLAPKKFENIPFRLIGTEFQRRVWSELQNIPLGETRTYGQIAEIVKSSPRAVGNACRNNPILIIIPCHRVVSTTGIGGFSGEQSGEKINIKRWLLAHEGVQL